MLLLKVLDLYDVYLSGYSIRRVRLDRRSGYVVIDSNRETAQSYAIFPDDFLEFLWHIPTIEKESIILLFDDFTFLQLVTEAKFYRRIDLSGFLPN